MSNFVSLSSPKSEGCVDNTSDSSSYSCPCENYVALSKIVETLESPEAVQSLVDWLDGAMDAKALTQEKLLSCGKRSRCRFRFGTSFAILNAIRDACRPYLESSSLSTPSKTGVVAEEGFASFKSAGKKKMALELSMPAPTYEEAFPSLGSSGPVAVANKPHPAASNILIPRKKTPTAGTKEQPHTLLPKKKSKRRIRPQLASPLTTTGAGTNSVWGQASSSSSAFGGPPFSSSSTSMLGSVRGNIANLPSEDPLTVVKATTPAAKNGMITPVKAVRPSLLLGNATTPETQTPKSLSFAPVTPTIRPPMIGDTASTTSSKTRDHTRQKMAPIEHLQRLVQIYIALFRNMLIPSTALELHLLIRLLAVDTQAVPPIQSTSTDMAVSFFQPVFCSPDRCQQFAALTLAKLRPIVRNLPIPLLQVLVECAPFRRQCPDLATELKEVLQEHGRHGLLGEHPPETVTGTHAILTLPFDKERDSRHNYRTQAEISVYKNREESRDAFLYELRTFMSIKGTILRPQEMVRAQDRVREEAKKILYGLLSVNMMWFAQFYCELLLQVGLSPVQETDKELLNIADKDKLQKLHKRFSSRSSHAGKSSKKVSISQRSNNSNDYISPIDEAKAFFPGYQEFFFLFLHQLPFNFGFHLRGRMAKTIVDLLSNLSSTNLERKIVELQLLARFLGYLIFSPNWHDAGIDSSKIQTTALADGLQQLESLGLPLNSNIQQAWEAGHVIAAVPWITELLRMAKWDSLSQTSRPFRQLLADLREIQGAMAWSDSTSECRFGPSMNVISFFLERFFHETSGLPKLTSLPQSKLSPAKLVPKDSLDSTHVGFTTIVIFSSSPHLEDLSTLIERMGQSLLAARSPSKARKLRPSIVSRGITLEPSRLFGDSMTERMSFSGAGDGRGSNGSLWLGTISTEKGNIETKLVEAFFHQHRGIKDICEFAVSEVLKDASNGIKMNCVLPCFNEHAITEESPDFEFAAAQDHAFEMAKEYLGNRLKSSIEQTLNILGPAHLHRRVIKTATSLSVSRGMRSGQSLLHSLVSNESKTMRGALQREKKKRDHGRSVKPADDNECITTAVDSIYAISKALADIEIESSNCGDCHYLLTNAIQCVQKLDAGSQKSVPSESNLRRLFIALLELDSSSSVLFRWRSSQESGKYAILSAFMRLTIEISAVSNYGLKKSTKQFDSGVIFQLVNSLSTDPAEHSRAITLLQDLVSQRIITLETVLACLENSQMSQQGRNIIDSIHA